MTHVGKEIRRLREEKGWSQAKLGVESGLGPSGISQIETGRRNPSAASLQRIAEALGLEVRDLFPLGQAPLLELDGEWRAPVLRGQIELVNHLATRWDEQIDRKDHEHDQDSAAVGRTKRIWRDLNWALEITRVSNALTEAFANDPNFRLYGRDEYGEMYAALRRMSAVVERTKPWFESGVALLDGEAEATTAADVIDLQERRQVMADREAAKRKLGLGA